MLSVSILKNKPNITWNKIIATHYSLLLSFNPTKNKKAQDHFEGVEETESDLRCVSRYYFFFSFHLFVDLQLIYGHLLCVLCTLLLIISGRNCRSLLQWTIEKWNEMKKPKRIKTRQTTDRIVKIENKKQVNEHAKWKNREFWGIFFSFLFKFQFLTYARTIQVQTVSFFFLSSMQ